MFAGRADGPHWYVTALALQTEYARSQASGIGEGSFARSRGPSASGVTAVSKPASAAWGRGLLVRPHPGAVTMVAVTHATANLAVQSVRVLNPAVAAKDHFRLPRHDAGWLSRVCLVNWAGPARYGCRLVAAHRLDGSGGQWRDKRHRGRPRDGAVGSGGTTSAGDASGSGGVSVYGTRLAWVADPVLAVARPSSATGAETARTPSGPAPEASDLVKPASGRRSVSHTGHAGQSEVLRYRCPLGHTRWVPWVLAMMNSLSSFLRGYDAAEGGRPSVVAKPYTVPCPFLPGTCCLGRNGRRASIPHASECASRRPRGR